jgi:putative transposase
MALDSTVLRLCLELSPWAQYHHEKGGCKLHTAIDLAGDLPEFVRITPGRAHDIPVARIHASFRPGTTLAFDRGYWNAPWLNELTERGIYFVTRQRRNNVFKVVKSRPTDRTRGYICDQVVYQVILKKRGKYRPKYRGVLRRISYNDPETGQRLTFLTNRWDLATRTICEIYKARWKVELFFKTLKQHLKVKKFLGTTLHAVTAQIMVALIAYVLVHLLRSIHQARLSMREAMAVVSTLLLLNQPIKHLFGNLPRTTRYPPDPQLAFAF